MGKQGINFIIFFLPMVNVYVISDAIKYNGRILVCSLERSEIGIQLWFPFCCRNLLFSVLFSCPFPSDSDLFHPVLSCFILSCPISVALAISSAELHLSPLYFRKILMMSLRFSC